MRLCRTKETPRGRLIAPSPRLHRQPPSHKRRSDPGYTRTRTPDTAPTQAIRPDDSRIPGRADHFWLPGGCSWLLPVMLRLPVTQRNCSATNAADPLARQWVMDVLSNNMTFQHAQKCKLLSICVNSIPKRDGVWTYARLRHSANPQAAQDRPPSGAVDRQRRSAAHCQSEMLARAGEDGGNAARR